MSLAISFPAVVEKLHTASVCQHAHINTHLRRLLQNYTPPPHVKRHLHTASACQHAHINRHRRILDAHTSNTHTHKSLSLSLCLFLKHTHTPTGSFSLRGVNYNFSSMHSQWHTYSYFRAPYTLFHIGACTCIRWGCSPQDAGAQSHVAARVSLYIYGFRYIYKVYIYMYMCVYIYSICQVCICIYLIYMLYILACISVHIWV
jgi:hypothetical protein